ncbi:MAG: serine/threonine-protein kinase [Polyangiaceae bacterium]
MTSSGSPDADGSLDLSDTTRMPPAPDAQPPSAKAPSAHELAATMPFVRHASEPRNVDPAPRALSGERYQIRTRLGVGGMGEVHLIRDGWLGRDVAMKVMRNASTAGSEGSEGRARFLREARVQGQLEHPSIVPVYDLAIDAVNNTPYFTMKRIQGLTLRDIIDGHAEGDPEVVAAFSRRKVLSALSQVCLAVAYAHARGVIHRDLKPENVMLGAFGEVYVLDWGVARIAGLAEAPIEADEPGAEAPPATAAGSMVGTPGYMAPEQVLGNLDAIGEATDVYALGCILFELLTLEPLHTATTVPALIASTMSKLPERPSARAPQLDIPPELDAIVVRALEREPSARHPSCRAFADELERFLDGERDQSRRRELALAHLENAREALELAAAGGDHADDARARGMRELGRALALDPTNEHAMQLVTRIVVAAPAELPPPAEAALKQVELADRASGSRRSAFAYLSWVLFAPIALAMGIKSWPLVIALEGAAGALTFYALWMSYSRRVEPRYMRISIFANFILISLLAAIFGPFILVPAAASTVAATLLVSLRANRPTRALITGLGMGSFMVPASLEWAGVLSPSLSFEGGALVVHPRMLAFPPAATLTFLVLTSLMQMLTTSVLVGRAIDAVVRAERKNFAQAYRLRQLLPAGDVQIGAPEPSQRAVCTVTAT